MEEPRRTRRQTREEQARQLRSAGDDFGTVSPRRLRTRNMNGLADLSPEDNKPHQGVLVENYSDMYTRVKRNRRPVKRDMYGMPLQGEKTTEEDESSSQEDGEQRDNEDNQGRSYSLRQERPKRQIFEAGVPSVKKRHKISLSSLLDRKSSRRKHRHRNRKLRSSAHSGSSSDSSSSSSDTDEDRFQRRQAKNTARLLKRCRPINFSSNDIPAVAKDRQKIGSSMANSECMAIDKSITFGSVGGLDRHIESLKEMVLFPLLYPEVFEQFKVTPPRGVLFHGPPGTGKTLVARALVNECSKGENRVAFFMRKGTDCLSKWIGEAERQLRLLFDQAYQMRPSIIFFDEIDGLTPVRSGRLEQSHDSIVTTLLALMDGLDNRGEIVVIGATNRIDAIDPALRRPGRFDREFHFSLPSKEARKEILKIHTREWNPKLCDSFLEETAARCVGYCGADLKALCSEATLSALRRRYPQIYTSQVKLQLDTQSIRIEALDFHLAMRKMVPAGQRSSTSPGRPLSPMILPLLQQQLEAAIGKLKLIFPSGFPDPEAAKPGSSASLKYSFNSETAPSIYQPKRKKPNSPEGSFFSAFKSSMELEMTRRPRCLLCGPPGWGQLAHLGPALVHAMEGLPVHTLDLPAMYSYQARTPEELCSQIFREAMKGAPSVVYMPHVDSWWLSVHDTVRASFIATISNLDPALPILLLASSSMPFQNLPFELVQLFQFGEKISVQPFMESTRYKFFEKLFLSIPFRIAQPKAVLEEHPLEVLPVAEPQAPRQLSEGEVRRLVEVEEESLRELRIILRDILNMLSKDRKFTIFTKPVDREEVVDYYDIITNPMDLYEMMSKIDHHVYETVGDFLADIDLISANALEYNPPISTQDKSIRHRASALKDQAHSLASERIDKDFVKHCEEIAQARKERAKGDNSKADHQRSLVLSPNAGQSSRSLRYSRRTRGHEPEEERLPASRPAHALTRSQSHNDSLPLSEADLLNPTASSYVLEIDDAVKPRDPEPLLNGVTGESSSSSDHQQGVRESGVRHGPVSMELEEDPESRDGLELGGGADVEQMRALLHETVRLTLGASLESLESLYSLIYRKIYARREEPNKAALLCDIKEVVSNFVL